MVDSALTPGQILGGRFAIVGALGSGGTATVYLAVDQLRGERIALKVVHAHLSRDPGTQRRLRREITAATLLSHDAALVPYDLHELDGRLCLSMPYHPGQTLTEHVGATGPLPIPDVRALGVRIAEALAAAHRAGLLHRDVTANNILIEAGQGAVLTDFGLARIESQATRSTGMLGTAGYAAPEVYSGERSDPRTDLYGLGCALYLAATGRAPFDTSSPMGALQQQLTESYTPVRELNSAVPDDLAETIHSLLRKNPEDRPQGARAVADALGDEVAATQPAPPAPQAQLAHLEPGTWAVVLRERDEDRARRRQLRVDARQQKKTFETEVSRRARDLVTGVLSYVGLHSADDPTPEDLLVQAVADQAGVGSDLRAAPALVQKEFVLAENISKRAAKQLASTARSAGFRARTGDAQTPHSKLQNTLILAVIVAGWIGIAPISDLGDNVLLVWIALMVGVTLIGNRIRRSRPTVDIDELPVAYNHTLHPWLSKPHAGRYPLHAEGAPPPQPIPEQAPTSRGQQLLQRTLVQLDGLRSTIHSLDLPAIARSDLRDTSRDLQERATDLAEAIDRIDSELNADTEDHSWVEPRLLRLRTKQRAGEPVDPTEITRLEATLASQQQSEALLSQLDSQLTTATAELLEIASTAARVRRELLAQPDPEHSASQALHKLQQEAQLADRARRELAQRSRERR